MIGRNDSPVAYALLPQWRPPPPPSLLSRAPLYPALRCILPWPPPPTPPVPVPGPTAAAMPSASKSKNRRTHPCRPSRSSALAARSSPASRAFGALTSPFPSSDGTVTWRPSSPPSSAHNPLFLCAASACGRGTMGQ